MHSFSQPIAIVAIKTTGMRVLHDRIMAIGVVLIDADGRHEWSSLVHPGLSIAPYVANATGINNASIAQAPRFAELAAALSERLHGRLLLAHHARLTYGFLKAEFARAGLRFYTRSLCTVRLSRVLNAGLERHNLPAVLAHNGIAHEHTAPALDTARALHQWLELAEQRHGLEPLRTAIAELNKRPTLPAYLDESLADELPESPGVYFFDGEHGLLYIGKAKNIRRRVLSHFAADLNDAKEMRLSHHVRRIRWEVTAGELGALLREARYVKQWQPLHNRQLRRQSHLISLSLKATADGVLMPEAVSGQELLLGKRLYGLFNSRAAITKRLRTLATRHGFCDYALGIERRTTRPCPSRQLKRCQGLCDGGESVASHNQRLSDALASDALTAWPFPGAIALEEYNAHDRIREFTVINHWCWLGSSQTLAEATQIAQNPSDLVLDKDSYRLLLSAILGKSALPIHALNGC